jgi:proteasome lid subunit RPN8/RPN11
MGVTPDRDVSQVVAAHYAERELPRLAEERADGFQVVFARSALNAMHAHGRSSADVEVCGVLVGNVYHDGHGPYLYVEASIKGDHAAGKTAQVTFTAETWNHINDEMEQKFAGRKILGWYHTHPGFGIFLSEMDLFIQNNFFPEPWQVAYVYDPKADEDGVFVWKNGQATRDPYLVDLDVASTDPARAAGHAPPPSGTLAELTARVQSLEQRVKALIGALFLVAALAVLSPLVAHLFLPAEREHDVTNDDPPPIPASLRPSASPGTQPAAEQ